jgi:hypothetical protein
MALRQRSASAHRRGMSGTDQSSFATRGLRLLRYRLSPPVFNVNASPMVLMAVPDPGFQRFRRIVLVILLGLAVLIGVQLVVFRDVDQPVEAVFALLAASALVVGLLVLPKRLLAEFGPTEVTVQEGGIRTPRSSWTARIDSFSGLSWRYVAAREWYMQFRFHQQTEYRRRAAPIVTEYHYIALVHPDPARTLILCLQNGDRDIEQRLGQFAKLLDRPIIERRVEERG